MSRVPRASVPRNEAERLGALADLKILDTPRDPALDGITRLAARHFKAPIALISLVDRDRQWFKSRLGLTLSQTSRAASFCAHTILHKRVLHVADASKDPRFADSPLVRGVLQLRFYAGAPLTVTGNCRVGTLCIFDRVPRDFSAGEREDLAALAALVAEVLEHRSQVGGEGEDRAARRLALIEGVNLAAASAPDADAALAETLRRLADFAGADLATLWTPGRSGHHPHSAVSDTLDPALAALCDKLGTIRGHLARRLGGGRADERRPFALADLNHPNLLRRGDYAVLREHGIRSVFSVPLDLEGEKPSLLFLFRLPQPHVMASTAEMLSLATQIALPLRRKQIEEELRRRSSAAEASNRAKLEFMAIMSHEFRTPLNAVIGFSEVMTRGMYGPLNQRYFDYATYIHRSGRHLLRIVGDILDLAKIESGSFELCRSPVDLVQLGEHCLQLLAQRASEGKLTFKRDIDHGLPVAEVDEVRVKQMVLNLLANAVKFTPAGGEITLSIARRPWGGLALRVADTGVGMREEDIPLAQQSFRQIDNSLTRHREGVGLGLPLVKHLAELHGGKLLMTSAVGRGTTATIELPGEIFGTSLGSAKA
jgi:signal transduction histidine kinase